MNEFDIIIFAVTDKYYGYPQPFISNGTVVVLIQEGRIQLSKHIEPTNENPVPTFEHPGDSIVNKELEEYLLNTIKEKYPQYLLLDESVVLTCPLKVAEMVVWQSSLAGQRRILY